MINDIANQVAANRREIEALKSIQKNSGAQIYRAVSTASLTTNQTSSGIAFKWFYVHAQSYDGTTPMGTMAFSYVDNRIGLGGNTIQWQQAFDNVSGRITWWIRVSWWSISSGTFTINPQVITNMPVNLTIEEGALEYDNT